MPQDADKFFPGADFGNALVTPVAVAGPKAQFPGDLQSSAQGLVNRLAKRVSSSAFVQHAGDAHQLFERCFQRRVLAGQVACYGFLHLIYLLIRKGRSPQLNQMAEAEAVGLKGRSPDGLIFSSESFALSA
jgi:hypothetical protein